MQPNDPHKLEYRRPDLSQEPPVPSRRTVRIVLWLVVSPFVGFLIPIFLYVLVGGWGIPCGYLVFFTLAGLIVGVVRANAISAEE